MPSTTTSLSRPSRSLRPSMVVVLLLTGLLLAVTTTVQARPDGTAVAAADSWSSAEQRQALLHSTHSVRDHNDLRKAYHDSCMTVHAQRWANELAQSGRFEHQSLGRVLRRCGLRSVGENLARGYPNGHHAVRAWIHSPGHRRNLLSSSSNALGVGAQRGADGWVYVQLLGRG